MIFIMISCGIYIRKQPLTKLLHHYLREEHLNETKELWHEHHVIELIIFNCTEIRLHLFFKLTISPTYMWLFFCEVYSCCIGNIRRWLKTKRRRKACTNKGGKACTNKGGNILIIYFRIVLAQETYAAG